jgi:hypothetical protein
VLLGQRVVVSAEDSRDPDGDSRLATFIRTPEGAEVRETEITRSFDAVGRYRFHVEVIDSHGAVGQADREVLVVVPPPPLPVAGAAPVAAGAAGSQPRAVAAGRHGCGCLAAGAPVTAWLGLAAALLCGWRRRRRML